MGTNSEFLLEGVLDIGLEISALTSEFLLEGVLDIGLEISALTSEFLPLSILAILAFNSSLFLSNGGI